MDNITRLDIVTIELNSGTIHRSWLNHSIGSADIQANAFGVDLVRDSQPVDLTGGSVFGYFRDPQGNNIAITTGYTIDGNRAYVVLPQACYNYEGQFVLAIKVIGGGVTGTMRIVDGMVDNTNTGGAVAPTETVPTYSEILAEYDAMVAATTAANTATTAANTAAANVGAIVASAYSTSATYAVGDYCTKDGNLYRCITDITSGESWTAAHWTAVSLGNDVASIGNDVSDLKSAIKTSQLDLSETTWTDGFYLDRDGSTYTMSSSAITGFISVDGVQILHIVTYLRKGVRFCKYDANQNVIGYYDQNTTTNWSKTDIDYDVSDASFIRLSCGVSYKGEFSLIVRVVDSFSEIDDKIEDITTDTIYSFSFGTWTDNKYLDSDGSTPTLNGASVSGYIDVSDCLSVNVTTTMVNGQYICLYDSDYNVIDYIRSNDASYTEKSYIINVLSASYIRLSCGTSAKSTASVNANIKGQIKKASDDLYPASFYSVEIPSWTDGVFLDSDGSTPTLNGASASSYIDIEGMCFANVNTTMVNGMYILIYDSDHNIIDRVRSNDSSYTEAIYHLELFGAKYIRISCRTAAKPSAKVYSDIKEQIGIITKKVNDVENGTVRLTLGNTYTTLNDILTYAGTIASADLRVLIYIPEGEYDAFAGIDLANESANFRGLIVPDYVDLIGVGSPENTIIKAELPADMTGYAYQRNSISTLNLWRNNNLKNLKVISKNMRYPVHNDKAINDEKDYYVEHFENCYFLANGESGVVADNIAFGSGMAKGAQLFFENCVFDSPMNPYMCANIHNRVNGKSPVTWSFKHCEFIGGQYSMLLTSYNSGQTDNLNFIGCKMDGKIIFQTALSSHQCDYKLFGAGNDLQGYVWNTSTEKPSAVAMMIS